MSETVQIAIVTALINGAVTWGIISTKLAWLRRDVDKLDSRVQSCEATLYRRETSDHRP